MTQTHWLYAKHYVETNFHIGNNAVCCNPPPPHTHTMGSHLRATKTGNDKKVKYRESNTMLVWSIFDGIYLQ